MGVPLRGKARAGGSRACTGLARLPGRPGSAGLLCPAPHPPQEKFRKSETGLPGRETGPSWNLCWFLLGPSHIPAASHTPQLGGRPPSTQWSERVWAVCGMPSSPWSSAHGLSLGDRELPGCTAPPPGRRARGRPGFPSSLDWDKGARPRADGGAVCSVSQQEGHPASAGNVKATALGSRLPNTTHPGLPPISLQHVFVGPNNLLSLWGLG